ncbi:MAG: hypothetical protein ABI689_12980 [Thermoanaerobaculia bacterium]
MFCPRCRSEYREGFTRCENCDVPLVATLPPEAGDPSDRDLVMAFETGDPGLLAMAHSILDEAQVPYLTQGEGIQDLFGVGRLGTGFSILTGPVHILVERGREAEVRGLLDGLEEDAAARQLDQGASEDERDSEPEV